MTRTAVSLAILSLGLAACASTAPQTTPRVATNEMSYRTGQGEVIAATQARPAISAAAGGTAGSASALAPVYRLTIRMSDGTVQYVDTDNPQITAGSTVQLGPDHTISKL
jgi:hypothetical protein